MTESQNTEWTQQEERSNTLALRIIVWVALKLGRTVARALIWPITAYFWATAPVARRASADYLRRVEAASGRPAGSLSTFRHLLTFSQVVLDRVFMLTPTRNPNEWFDTQKVHASGSGGIFVGAHVGSFEAMRVLGTRDPAKHEQFRHEQLGDLIVRMAMYSENARKINAMLTAINPNALQHVIELGQPDAMLQIQSTIDRGEFVGLLADRQLEGATDQDSNTLSFLDAPASLPIGPFRLAAVLKRPVFLVMGLYQGGNRYDIHFEPLPSPDIADRRKRAEAIAQWQAAYVARIEYHCKQAPYNWFNFYDFWRS
jgi:predicted LPLAT superfamily acyltransferase